MSSFTKDFTIGGGPKIVIKPIDPPDLNKGAEKAVAASIAQFVNPPGPRDAVRQAPFSKNQAQSGTTSTKNYQGVGG